MLEFLKAIWGVILWLWLFILDHVAFCSLIVAIIGAVFAYAQWKKSMQIKRAEYLYELLEKIRTDEDIREANYLFQYEDNLWYDEKFHNSGNLERKVDKTLNFFSYICYLAYGDLITDEEFCLFDFDIKSALNDIQTKNYLFNLYHFSNKSGRVIPFYYLYQYGQDNNMFDEDFYNENSKKYPHYIF